MRLAESERSVLTVLWDKGPTTAKEIAAILNHRIGWSKTTTYTVLKRAVDKGYILREEPNFVCTALLTRERVADLETEALLRNHFNGSADLLVASLLDDRRLTAQGIQKLLEILEEET